MRYPVGTRVWVRMFGHATSARVDAHSANAMMIGTVGRSKIDGSLVRFTLTAIDQDITAALIPGPTDDPGPLARQLERYAKEAEK